MNSDPTWSASDGDPVEQGIALVLRAEETGDWKPVVDWLADHAELAEDLARFLGGQDRIRREFAPVRISLQSGSVVGGYTLLDEIGRGGMGVVFRAYDPVLKRDVAVKLVKPAEGFDPERLARFRFEAETVANLDHPNIVRLFAYGESDGLPYIVMPLLEGSLAKRLEIDGPMPHRKAAELLRDIAHGVHHAHQQALIHRDLKPANILLDAEGRPQVADFGLARSLESTVTASGGLAGTPAYMAPEQARGDKALTTGVDVHALGAILFELLTGRPPFGKSDEVLRTLKRVQEEPVASVRGHRADVPADLDAICRKCLQKETADRYASAEALAEDLTRYLNGEMILAREPSVIAGIGRAVSHRPDRLLITSWPGFLMGAAVTFVTQGICQAAVLEGASGWTVVAGFTINLFGWFAFYWYFIVLRAEWKTSAMGQSGAYILAVLLGAAALIPAHLSGDRDVALKFFQPFTAVFGVGAFVHGVTIWGRMYYAGSTLLAIAALMPLIPIQYWPTVHAVSFGGFAIWFGLWMRHFDQVARFENTPR